MKIAETLIKCLGYFHKINFAKNIKKSANLVTLEQPGKPACVNNDMWQQQKVGIRVVVLNDPLRNKCCYFLLIFD